MRATRRASIVTLLFVYLAVRVFWWYDAHEWSEAAEFLALTGVLKVLVWVAPAILFVMIVRGMYLHDALDYLGLDAAPLRGLGFGLLATLPLAFVVVLAVPHKVDSLTLVGIVLIGPFAEEVLFRGFLMKELLSQARLPVAWAIGVSAVAFGMAHIPDLDWKTIGSVYQLTTHRAGLAEQRLLSMVFDVATMGAGGAIFGWVFYRLGSLWPAIALHGCVNLWRALAESDPAPVPRVDAVGIAQAAALAAAVLLTLRRRPMLTAASPAPLS